MRPVIFPRWPEKAAIVVVFIAIIAVVVVAITAGERFGGEAAFAAVLGGSPSILSSFVIVYFVRRHRMKSELRARNYDEMLQGLSYDG